MLTISDNTGAGLCESCLHRRVMISDRGSRFVMCERWKEAGSRFPKYPRLPVHECAGYVKRTDDPGEKKNDVEGNK